MKKFFILLSIVSLHISVFTQNITGYGNVSSISGLKIPNAVVKISAISDTITTFEHICDKNGNYTFDFNNNDSVYIFTILPSVQTLQFIPFTDTILLSFGNNGILYHKVELTVNNSIVFTVVDTTGNPLSGAKVILYDKKGKWRIDSCRMSYPELTDVNGQVTINSLLPGEYWFNIRHNYKTNRFTVNNLIIDTNLITNITVPVRDLSQMEFYLCGPCDNKTWITDSMVIFGISQPYNADSKLLSDATWYDSNGNHGFWWFNNDETKLTYDYDTSSTNGGGSTVEASLIYLTDSSFAGDMTMLGLPVTYYMSAIYDTANLIVSCNDTILFLNNNSQAFLSSDDLFIDSDNYFNCDTVLSQTVFDNSDIGTNDVYVTLTDRCGNQAIDTITVTIIGTNSIGELSKSNIKMYPNPAHNYIIIEAKEKPLYSISLFDINGKIIKYVTPNKNKYLLNTQELRQGFYYIKINNYLSYKFIKQ